jgi:hypothetical protein
MFNGMYGDGRIWWVDEVWLITWRSWTRSCAVRVPFVENRLTRGFRVWFCWQNFTFLFLQEHAYCWQFHKCVSCFFLGCRRHSVSSSSVFCSGKVTRDRRRVRSMKRDLRRWSEVYVDQLVCWCRFWCLLLVSCQRHGKLSPHPSRLGRSFV